jgi:hypothetical protein
VTVIDIKQVLEGHLVIYEKRLHEVVEVNVDEKTGAIVIRGRWVACRHPSTYAWITFPIRRRVFTFPEKMTSFTVLD